MIFTGTPFRRSAGGLVVLLLLVVAAAAWLGWRGWQTRAELLQARVSLEAARSGLVERDFPASRAAVTEAGARTERARRLTGDPVWRAAAAVPLLGNSLQTVRGLAVAADDVARDVLPAALDAGAAVDPATLRRPDGRIDLARVETADPEVQAVARAAVQVASAARGLPDEALAPPVREARRSFLAEVDELAATLTGAADFLSIAPTLLGDDRPRRYLVIAQQTSESRGTGGLPGGYAWIEAVDGSIRVLRSGSNVDFRDSRIPAPAGVPQDWVDRYEPRGALSLWSNVNFSPDLPVVARVFAARWKAQGGGELDGVAMLDPRALALLLEGAPPLRFSDGTTLPTGQIEQFLAVDQYRDEEQQVGGMRKERLAEVAESALAAVVEPSGDAARVFDGMARALRSGHLRLASDDPVLAPVLRRTGVDGHLPDGPAPVAYPVIWNGVGEKLDHWVDRSITYEAEGCGTAYRRSRITTTLKGSPPEGLPRYLTIRIQDGIPLQSRTAQVALNVYGTRGARLVRATLDGQPVSAVQGRTPVQLSSGTEAGLPVWTVPVDLPPGQERTFVLDLVEPTAPGAARVPEQPLPRELRRTVEVPVC